MSLIFSRRFEVKMLQNEFMEIFPKTPCRLPLLGFSRGSFVILRKTKVFGVNIAFKCLDVIFRGLKHVKLVTERES